MNQAMTLNGRLIKISSAEKGEFTVERNGQTYRVIREYKDGTAIVVQELPPFADTLHIYATLHSGSEYNIYCIETLTDVSAFLSAMDWATFKVLSEDKVIIEGDDSGITIHEGWIDDTWYLRADGTVEFYGF